MIAVLNRWLPGATLAVWSSVLLSFSIAGRLNAFLSPSYRHLVLPAGLVLAVMALVFLFFPADPACCRAADCGHPLSRSALGKWLTFLILVVPVAVSARYTPTGFSLNAMQNRGIVTDASALPNVPRSLALASEAKTNEPAAPSASDPLALPLPQSDPNAQAAAPGSIDITAPQTAAAIPAAAPAAEANPLESYVQKTKEGYLEAEVLDLLYAAQDGTLRKVFEGKTVQMIGQIMPDPADTEQGHRFKVVRMFMTCCAADARPVATAVSVPEVPKLPEMTWVKIVGTATFPVDNGRRAAVLKADKVEKTDPPEETMLY